MAVVPKSAEEPITSKTDIVVLPNRVFDTHHPPAPDLMDQCVHCGFCLPACPTYQLWHEEMDSPRGRIYLMKMATDGQLAAMDRTFVDHIDRCLGCMACMTACPSGVDYEKLVEATRAQIERRYPRRFWERVFRKLIFSLFPHPRRLRASAFLLWVYQRSGLRWLVHRLGLPKLLPPGLQEMEALLPDVSLSMLRTRVPARIAPRGTRRARVGLLLGCVQRVFYPHVNAATARVLSAEGCEVLVPSGQGCCGALMTHTGREDHAIAAAKRLIDAFEALDVDYIVINAAGCGSNMKAYGHLLRDDPEYAARAKSFAAKCRDVSELLATLEPRAPRHPVPMRLAYHDACHLQHAQGIRLAPRELLKGIPQLEVVELPEGMTCCGSAGVYNLLEPAPARQLGDRKARHVINSKAQAVATGNPGCLLQLKTSLERRNHRVPTYHIVEVLDRSISGR